MCFFHLKNHKKKCIIKCFECLERNFSPIQKVTSFEHMSQYVFLYRLLLWNRYFRYFDQSETRQHYLKPPTKPPKKYLFFPVLLSYLFVCKNMFLHVFVCFSTFRTIVLDWTWNRVDLMVSICAMLVRHVFLLGNLANAISPKFCANALSQLACKKSHPVWNCLQSSFPESHFTRNYVARNQSYVE